jgi:hypothetical protein
MADPREEEAGKEIEDAGAPSTESELSDADFEKVSGGIKMPETDNCTY